MDQDIRTDKGSMGSEEIKGRGKPKAASEFIDALTRNQDNTTKRGGQDTGRQDSFLFSLNTECTSGRNLEEWKLVDASPAMSRNCMQNSQFHRLSPTALLPPLKKNDAGHHRQA